MRCSYTEFVKEGGSFGWYLLWETDLSEQVESSVLFLENRAIPWVICLPVSIGCPMGCGFCAMPRCSNPRELTTRELWEIVDSSIEHHVPARPFQISFMGQGEPLYNPAHLFDFCARACKQWADMRVGLATVGIEAGIRHLQEQDWAARVQLQISVHALPGAKRVFCVPAEHYYPIEDALIAGARFARSTKNTVFLGWVMIRDYNDSPTDAMLVADAVGREDFCVKLCELNPPPGCTWCSAEENSFRAFASVLAQRGVRHYRFRSIGQTSCIGCGQTRLPHHGAPDGI